MRMKSGMWWKSHWPQALLFSAAFKLSRSKISPLPLSSQGLSRST
jgi:hypothetical protein